MDVRIACYEAGMGKWKIGCRGICDGVWRVAQQSRERSAAADGCAASGFCEQLGRGEWANTFDLRVDTLVVPKREVTTPV